MAKLIHVLNLKDTRNESCVNVFARKLEGTFKVV